MHDIAAAGKAVHPAPTVLHGGHPAPFAPVRTSNPDAEKRRREAVMELWFQTLQGQDNVGHTSCLTCRWRLARCAAFILHAGGAYPHLGCQSRGRSSHRGQPHPRPPAPGRTGASEGQEARALTGCSGPGPGASSRRGVLAARDPVREEECAENVARMSHRGVRARVVSSPPRFPSPPQRLPPAGIPALRPHGSMHPHLFQLDGPRRVAGRAIRTMLSVLTPCGEQ